MTDPDQLRVGQTDVETSLAETARLRAQVAAYRAALATNSPAAAQEVSELFLSQTPEAMAARLREESLLSSECDRLTRVVQDHESTIGDLRVRIWNLGANVVELQGKLAESRSAGAPPVPDLDEGTTVLGEKVRFNDLTIVKGIGPRIADMLDNAGIKTWWDLRNSDVAVLNVLLQQAGPRFRVHDPGTWSHQAGLLARGEWQQFKTFTDGLDGHHGPS